MVSGGIGRKEGRIIFDVKVNVTHRSLTTFTSPHSLIFGLTRNSVLGCLMFSLTKKMG